MGSIAGIVFYDYLVTIAYQYTHRIGCQCYPVFLESRFFGMPICSRSLAGLISNFSSCVSYAKDALTTGLAGMAYFLSSE